MLVLLYMHNMHTYYVVNMYGRRRLIIFADYIRNEKKKHIIIFGICRCSWYNNMIQCICIQAGIINTDSSSRILLK